MSALFIAEFKTLDVTTCSLKTLHCEPDRYANDHDSRFCIGVHSGVFFFSFFFLLSTWLSVAHPWRSDTTMPDFLSRSTIICVPRGAKRIKLHFQSIRSPQQHMRMRSHVCPRNVCCVSCDSVLFLLVCLYAPVVVDYSIGCKREKFTRCTWQ